MFSTFRLSPCLDWKLVEKLGSGYVYPLFVINFDRTPSLSVLATVQVFFSQYLEVSIFSSFE